MVDPKDPRAKLPYSFDWSKAHPGRTIVDSSWEVHDDISIAGEEVSGLITTVVLDGGAPGKTYRVRNIITLDDGTRNARTMQITVQEK